MTTTSRGRRRGSPDTRASILEAARTLFAENGFSGTSVRAVAGAAGVDPALVHHYFGSKDDLFVASLALVLVPGATALDIADANPTTGVVGQPYSFTFQLSPGSGSPGASWSVKSGSLPPGLRLSSNDRTALVYGTPTQAGSFSFYLEVRDAPGPWVCCTQEQFTIVIVEGLGIVQSTLPSGSVGVQYGYQLTTSGGNATSWAVTAGALPAGLTLTASGAITGTPTQTASSTFTVRASDGSRVASKQFTLHVVEPLVVTAPPAKAIKFGRSFLLTLTARGGLAPYKWSAPSLPPGINVNPLTGQEYITKDRPAHNKVNMRPIKALKESLK